MNSKAGEGGRDQEKFVPLPRQLTQGQLEAIRALPAHNKAPTPTVEASRPTRIYTDPERFKAEMEHVFGRFAVPASPSCSLPEPNSYVAIDGFGLPIVLTRDKDGTAHAFVNVCTHRGSKLVTECQVAQGGRLICPYHAWTFGLDGTLLGVPRGETFPSLDRSELGLLRLPTYEKAGYIWVGLHEDRPAELPDRADTLDAELRALGLPTMHIYGQRYYDLKSNWKLVVEPFMEAYHVQRLHANTVASMNADNNPIMVWLGPHLRQTAGRIEFDPAEGNDLTSDRMHRTITHAYYIFPNTIIVTSPYFISTMVLMPRAVDRTIVQYSMLMPQPIRNAKAEDLFHRSYEFQDRIFREDFSAGELQQEALGAGRLKSVRFGGLEAPIGPFHDLLEGFLPSSCI